ncbi:Fc.00g085570.m01.CDS01 [Cosmosporella sp. VM-42]
MAESEPKPPGPQVTVVAPRSSEDDGLPRIASVPRAQPPLSSALLKNPLEHLTQEQILQDVNIFTQERGLASHRDAFYKGALMAKVQNDPTAFENIDLLTEADKGILRYENEHRWKSQPKMLYFLCALCAGCAIVQGMDQTVISGAQLSLFQEFHISGPMMQGFINGAPYASSALIGCWLNAPLNSRFGRRGTLFFACGLAFITNIWQAAANSMPVFLAGRIVLGLAVGAKSSTTPIYAAECAPKNIRGALTMMWQMWTAFGIMIGYASSLAFQHCDFMGPNTEWRWMFGSTALPPLIVGLLIYCVPESPRWYMDKGKFQEAFVALRKLRRSDIQAARDMYLAWKLIEIERLQNRGHNVFKEFFGVRRNWRAAQSSWFCMIMQQFCGVNVIAYYSTKIFTEAGYTTSQALLASFGGGAINWIFALPAVWTIDTFGRRNLLLTTFPLMAVCLFWTGLNFGIDDPTARLASLATSIYIFWAVYSPGLGPVPFTYSAEAFPLHIRALGMASATSITWTFNFLLAFTWPMLKNAFGPSGAFFWYASWNVFGWIFCYFLLPETKARTLEELDKVFSMSNGEHAKYYFERLPWYALKAARQHPAPMRPLYEQDFVENKTSPGV